MKRFSSLRKQKVKGKTRSFNGIKVVVTNEKGKYVAYVDGDPLDAYRTEREAFKAGETFIKQYRDMK